MSCKRPNLVPVSLTNDVHFLYRTTRILGILTTETKVFRGKRGELPLGDNKDREPLNLEKLQKKTVNFELWVIFKKRSLGRLRACFTENFSGRFVRARFYRPSKIGQVPRPKRPESRRGRRYRSAPVVGVKIVLTNFQPHPSYQDRTMSFGAPGTFS